MIAGDCRLLRAAGGGGTKIRLFYFFLSLFFILLEVMVVEVAVMTVDMQMYIIFEGKRYQWFMSRFFVFVPKSLEIGLF